VSEHVKTELTDGVLVVTLQRPDKKNAITGAMYNAMSDALDRAETDAAVKVVLFQGDGDSFTAGNDLADFAAQSKSNSDEESPAFRFISTIGKASKPLIAAVQGNAVGIGTTMLLHCDLVYLAEGARLITPFVNLALVPEAASSWLLPARVGHVRAYQMFALGEPMDATTAVASGLANAVVPVGEVRQKAMAAAITLTKRPAGSLSATKRLMRDIERIQTIMNGEAELFRDRLKTPEAREAFTAFAERRPPNFDKLPS
jgi:enoyl-CoA hydratase/carnithine racemase